MSGYWNHPSPDDRESGERQSNRQSYPVRNQAHHPGSQGPFPASTFHHQDSYQGHTYPGQQATPSGIAHQEWTGFPQGAPTNINLPGSYSPPFGMQSPPLELPSSGPAVSGHTAVAIPAAINPHIHHGPPTLAPSAVPESSGQQFILPPQKGRTIIPCKHCEMTFDRPSAHDQHVLTHTGEKPHACEVCAAQFASKSNLKRHKDSKKCRMRSQIGPSSPLASSSQLGTATGSLVGSSFHPSPSPGAE